MDIAAVDKLTDDMADLQDESCPQSSQSFCRRRASGSPDLLPRMKAINEALAQGSMVPDGATDDELANDRNSERECHCETSQLERSSLGFAQEFAKLEEERGQQTE